MNLLKLRTKYQISQFELTVFLGMDQKTYHNIENEITLRTKIDVYIKLAFLYDVSIDYLLGITDIEKQFPKDRKKEVIEKYDINLYLVKKLREKGNFIEPHKSTAPSP